MCEELGESRDRVCIRIKAKPEDQKMSWIKDLQLIRTGIIREIINTESSLSEANENIVDAERIAMELGNIPEDDWHHADTFMDLMAALEFLRDALLRALSGVLAAHATARSYRSLICPLPLEADDTKPEESTNAQGAA